MAEGRGVLHKVRRVASWVVDGLTVIIVLVCCWLLSRPGSPVRIAWNSYRATAATQKAAEQNWRQLVNTATRLYDGEKAPLAIEISDYECPFCRRAAPAVDSALADGARIAYLHVSMRREGPGMHAAVAAVCAARQGKFREMHGHLMRTSEWQTIPDWRRDAAVAGIRDLDEFEACMTSDAPRARLRLHQALAESLGVSGTPTFVSRRKVIRGPADAENLLSLATER